MASVGQIYHNVLDTNNGEYISSKDSKGNVIDIFTNIVNQYGEGIDHFIKLGVQAPPGTQMVLNDSKYIMIGRTGMYELDADIEIKTMYFVRPRKYKKNDEESQGLKELGEREMKSADSDRTAALTDFYQKYPEVPNEDTDPEAYTKYWESYTNIQSEYIDDYQTALNKFNQGNNGIYELPNPDDVDAEENYEELYHVIVDFLYE